MGRGQISNHEKLGYMKPRNRLTIRYKFAIITVAELNSKSFEVNTMTTCVILNEYDDNLRYSIIYPRSTE